MNTIKKTYKEVIAICGEEFNPSVAIGDGQTISASCWTDDDEVLNWEAAFDIITSWGEGKIGAYDNLKGELDIHLIKLADMISAKVGGTWFYDAADCQLKQA